MRTQEVSPRHRYLVIGSVLAARELADGALAGEAVVIAEDETEAARVVGPHGITAAILIGTRNERDERGAFELVLRSRAFTDVPVALVGPLPTLSARIELLRLGAAGVLDEHATLEEIDGVLGTGPADDCMELAIDRTPAAALERALHMLRAHCFTGTLGASVTTDLGVVSFVKGLLVGTRFRGQFDDDALCALLSAARLDDVEFDVLASTEDATDDNVEARGLNVLLIEDDTETRRIYSAFLASAGFHVTTAPTPEEGLKCAHEARPDVIVTDLHMPRVDGWRVLAELRNDAATLDARLVLYSALHEILGDLEHTGASADAFVKKDGHARTLVDVVRKLGASRARLRTRLASGQSVSACTSDISLGAILTEAAKRPGWLLVLVDDDWTRAEINIEDGCFSSASATTPAGPLQGIAALGHALTLRPARVEVVALPWSPAQGGMPMAALLDELRTGQLVEQQRTVDARLAADAPLAFSRDRLRVYRHRVPIAVRPALAALSRGETPRSLVESGAFEPMLIDQLVTDVVRRGVARPVARADGAPGHADPLTAH